MKGLSRNISTLLFISLTGILIVVSFISFNTIKKNYSSVDWMMKSNMIKSNVNDVLSSLKDAEIGQRGYFYTKDSVFLQTFNGAEKRINISFATLDSLLKDDSAQLENLNRFKKLVDEKYFILVTNLKLFNVSQLDSIKDKALLKGKNKMDEVRKQFVLMLQIEDNKIAQHILVKDQTATVTPISLLILSLFSILIISLFFIRLQKETQMRIHSEESEKLLDEKVNNRTIQLSERNSFIETLIDSSIDLIIVFDKKLCYLSMNKIANQYFEEYFGRSVIGKRIDEVNLQADQSKAYDNALSALGGKIVFQKNIKSTFDQRYYDIDYIPLRNENEIYGVMTIVRDVTERFTAAQKLKEVNAQLEERNNFVETILETSKEYIAVYTKDFTLIELNKATEELMGKKRKDLIGLKLLEIAPLVKGTKSEKDLQSAFDGISIHNEPFQSLTTGRYIENYIMPLKDRNGNIYAALAMANDVTNIILKQKEVEEANNLLQLQNQTFEIAESIAKFGSYRWNIKSGTMEYSDNLFRLLDFEPQEFIPSYEKSLSFIHPEDLTQVINNGEKTLQTGLVSETPYRVISKTGEIKYFRSSGKFSSESGNNILIVAVQDITSDVEASNELQNKNNELENANAELASFSYVASHDLQEPLRKIQGFSKRIIEKDEENLSDVGKEYFSRIIAAANRMEKLIKSLLSFSSTNLSEVDFLETNLNQTLSEALNVLNEKITNLGVVIESETLPTLKAVPLQMHQLFSNLIGNSIKYSKPGVPTQIKISVEKIYSNENEGPINKDNTYWKIAFSDNGIGFEQEFENKIFEIFQRLHSKSEYEGTGIGLAICKKIVVAHNGTISASGVPNVGSTFTVLLPDHHIS